MDSPGRPGDGYAARRYAPIAAVMNGFYRRLLRESRATPYPADELAQLCDLPDRVDPGGARSYGE